MNPQYPFPNPPFSHNPLNPNPNFPNPQFNFAIPPHPPLIQHQFQNPLLDLPNTLSSLKTLIQSTNSTLQSLSSLIPSISPNSNSLVQCPSNPNHWVPSSSLFLHSLNCPTPLDIGRVVETLQYPKTLTNDQNLIQGSKFVQSIDDPTSEFCFSIDDYVDLDTNFYYQDCPGVVSSVNSDVSRRMFTLPGVLSVECANFVGCGDKGSAGFRGSSVKVLPSGVWFVEREVEQWSDYPNEYSLTVVKAILCVECVKECDLSMWVIENSSRFGVVIDVSMRDHMCVLFRLCLKAMVREGTCSYGSLLKSHIDNGSRNYNPRSLNFKCPALVAVLRWLTSQLSILYGEINSRSLVIAMIRHLLSKAASNALFFPLEKKLAETHGNEQATDLPRAQSSNKVIENEGNYSTYETIFSRPIFVYQIAAAIAALHERSSLEERIRALRNPPRLTPYQRLAEHSHFSKKADEERQKRPEYRPLIDHDGLFNQRQRDQGGDKAKTKEELLAEERDYKRRRMSYRGKKLKRSTKEVTRDIIEDYMEAIKHTGGIGGPSKGDSEGSVLRSPNSSAMPASNSKINHGSNTDMHDDNNTLLDNDYNYHDTKPILASRRPVRHQKESYSYGRSDDWRTTSRDRHDRDYDSRSPSNDRRHSRSKEHISRSKEYRSPSKDRRHSRSIEYRSPSKDRRHSPSKEHRSHSRNRGVSEYERSKSKYSSSNRASHHDYKLQNSTSSSLKISSGRKDKRKSDSPDRQRWQRHKYGNSDSFESVEINDRYDPSETSHTYDKLPQ